MYKFCYLLLIVIVSLTFSCKQTHKNNYLLPKENGLQTGGIKIIEINTSKGKFKIWTKTIGNNPTKRLLLLNGGPGATHEYFECFESFLPQENIEFIYYDQLGCGNSDNPNDTAMWDLPRYVEEVEQLRIALNLDKTNFYLLGHSWGGILAMQYALKYQQNLKGLIISNMMASAIEYDKYADQVLAKQLDPKVLDSIRTMEANADYQNPKYMDILYRHFYTQHILRMDLDKWPEPVNRSFSKINQSLYVTMQGPSEFGLSGKLEKWDVFNELSNIEIPTLVIGAKHDTMDPQYMESMSKKIKKSSFLLCPNGSHMCMWDDQKIYFDGLLDWFSKN